jgi:hypothetical protein
MKGVLEGTLCCMQLNIDFVCSVHFRDVPVQKALDSSLDRLGLQFGEVWTNVRCIGS